MKKKLIVIAGVLIATQVLSGCYFLREINWSKDLVPKKENTTATIGLQPDGADEASYFFMIAIGKGGGFTFKPPTFDSKDVTNQKQKMIEDEDLGEFVGDNCDFFTPPTARSYRGPSDVPIWRTEEVVSSEGPEFVEAKLKAKRMTPNGGGGFAGLVLTGEWIDDGDGVPEDPDSTDDSISCTGEATTSFILKGTTG